MEEFARTQGLSLSDDTLAGLIANNPAFQDSTGKFNRDIFRNATQRVQMREGEYIAQQNKTAIRSQIARSFSTGTLVSDVFKSALSAFTQEQRKFDYLVITPKLAGEPPAPTDGQLKSFFTENKATYKAPEYRKLVLLTAEPKDLADEKSISDEVVFKDYNAHIQSYTKPAQRRVQQIVFKSQENADTAVKDLAEGAVFETILSDNKVKLSDADLGMVTENKLPKALREEAFSLEVNTPSKILKGPFGPTMIRVTEIQDVNVTSFEDAKDGIRKDLALREAAEKIADMVETVEDMRAGGASIEDVGKRLGLKTRTIEAIDRSSRKPDEAIINDLPSSAKLLAQVFSQVVGAQADPLDVGKAGYVWADVISITPTRDREMKEVTDKVKTDWVAAERAQLVSKLADKLHKKLKSGSSFADIATEQKAELKTTALLKRAAVEGIFSRAANLAGFGGGAKHTAIIDSDIKGDKILLSVAEISQPEAQIVSVPERELNIANEGIAEDLLIQLVNNLRNGYSVTQTQHSLTG